MTSTQRLVGLIEAVRYLREAEIEGDVVECGVWRGGSSMAAAEALLAVGDTTRHLHLFDTFEGMPPPGDHDVAFTGSSAADLMAAETRAEGRGIWCFATRADVEANMARTGYPAEKIHLVEGRVEETLPGHAPERIALLRLDTDWYESTRHELEHLYPRLTPGGVLILDDYGHWAGAKKAVDDYFAAHPARPHLCRLDYTGRLAVKR